MDLIDPSLVCLPSDGTRRSANLFDDKEKLLRNTGRPAPQGRTPIVVRDGSGRRATLRCFHAVITHLPMIHRHLATVGPMDIVRVFTGTDGQSHFEDVTVDLHDLGAAGRISKTWPSSGVQFRDVAGDYFLDFHVAPRRQLVVNLTGSVELEIGSGERRVFGPGSILLAEDTTGQGHISRDVGGEPRTCLFIHLDDG
jgi:hypothetical protein